MMRVRRVVRLVASPEPQLLRAKRIGDSLGAADEMSRFNHVVIVYTISDCTIKLS